MTTLGTGWGCMEKRTAGLELWDGRFGGWSAPLERLAVAHQLLAQRNFQCGEDGIRPAPSDGAVATVARASAGRCWPHRSLLWSIVPGTELYFTGLDLVPQDGSKQRFGLPASDELSYSIRVSILHTPGTTLTHADASVTISLRAPHRHLRRLRTRKHRPLSPISSVHYGCV